MSPVRINTLTVIHQVVMATDVGGNIIKRWRLPHRRLSNEVRGAILFDVH